MPPVFNLKCSCCRYINGFTLGQMIVVDNEGQEHYCLHPREISMAEYIGGKSIELLEEEDRFYCGRPLLCNHCGDIQYYRDDMISENDINHKLGHEITVLSCKKCQHNNLCLPVPFSGLPNLPAAYRGIDDIAVIYISTFILFSITAQVSIACGIGVSSMLKISSFWLYLPISISIIALGFLWLWIANNIFPRDPTNYWGKIPCPQCKKKRLSFKMVGMS